MSNFEQRNDSFVWDFEQWNNIKEWNDTKENLKWFKEDFKEEMEVVTVFKNLDKKWEKIIKTVLEDNLKKSVLIKHPDYLWIA